MPLALVRAVVRSRPRLNRTAAPLIGIPREFVTFVDTVAVSPYCTFVAPRFVMTAGGGPEHLLSPAGHMAPGALVVADGPSAARVAVRVVVRCGVPDAADRVLVGLPGDRHGGDLTREL